MKIKTKKRQGRAARRAGVCKQCTPVERFKLPPTAKNHLSAPCAKCGRVLHVDYHIINNPSDVADLISAISPYPDVCFEHFESIYKGDPMPSEDEKGHCDKAHVLLIKNYTRYDELDA
jgi:uncharacterized Zn finger protein